MTHAPRSMARAVASPLACFILCAAQLSCGPPPGVRYHGLPALEEGALHFVNFDVGQGDALLVLYKGKSMLIDAGASRWEPQRGAQRIPPRLDALLGSRHLDYFVATHFHQDHLGMPGRTTNNREAAGIYALIERHGITIDTFIDRGSFNLGAKAPTQRKLEHALEGWLASGAVRERRTAHVGGAIDLAPGLRIDVIAASANGLLDRLAALYPDVFGRAPPSENDYSIALKLTLGDFEYFVGGDLTGVDAVRRFGPREESNTDIESRIAASVGPVEIYRVNHHGSGGSSNACFTQVLQPRVSIFSTGENSYGHPNTEVVARLRTMGDVFVTGGADPRVRAEVAPDIVGGDIEVLVAPDGSRYWVNGKAYVSTPETEERARPTFRAACGDETAAPKNPYETTVIEDEGMTD